MHSFNFWQATLWRYCKTINTTNVYLT